MEPLSVLYIFNDIQCTRMQRRSFHATDCNKCNSWCINVATQPTSSDAEETVCCLGTCYQIKTDIYMHHSVLYLLSIRRVPRMMVQPLKLLMLSASTYSGASQTANTSTHCDR